MASYVFNPFTGALTPAGGGGGLPTTGGTLTGDVTLNAQSDVRFADSDSSHYIALQAPATVTANVTMTLPAADGTNGQVLTTNGAGTLSFTTGAGGATDKIEEGNTSAEVIDTGSDGRFVVTTEGTERLRIDSNGDLLSGTTSNLGYGGRNIILKSGQGYAGIASLTTESRIFSTYDTTAIPMTFFQGGTERMRLDSSNRLLIGTSSAVGGIGASAKLQVKGNASTTGAKLSFQRDQAAASIGTGEEVGQLVFSSSDGGDYALITARSDGASSSTSDCPGRLEFSTTPDGSASPTEAMRINNQQELLIGTSTRNANGGVLQLKSGITFPATAVAASDANTLDDYEEGTWTPAFTPASGSFTTITFSNVQGFYTKVGRFVTISWLISVATLTVGTASGNLSISGLPFSIPSDVGHRGSCAVSNCNGWVGSNNPESLGSIGGGTTLLIFKRTSAGAAQAIAQASDLAVGSTFTVNYSYMAG